MTQSNKQDGEKLTTDNVIFNIEDYVGGNIEGIDQVDHMGFTVFLRQQLEAYRKQHELEARIDENKLLMDRYTQIARGKTGMAISPLIIANRLSELSTINENKK